MSYGVFGVFGSSAKHILNAYGEQQISNLQYLGVEA